MSRWTARNRSPACVRSLGSSRIVPSFRLTPRAEADRDAIVKDGLPEWGKRRVEDYLDDLEACFEHLAAFPNMERPATRSVGAIAASRSKRTTSTTALTRRASSLSASTRSAWRRTRPSSTKGIWNERRSPLPVPDGQAVPALPHPSAVVIHAPGGFWMKLPPFIADAGEDAARRRSSSSRRGFRTRTPARPMAARSLRSAHGVRPTA